MLEHPGIYVHFPWCVKKCPYCDFNSHPLKTSDDFAGYAACLQADFSAQRPATVYASAFLGGGTPSLFAPDLVRQVLTDIPFVDDAEITMEANPGTTEYSNFAAYRDAGVNRLSIGAQSFNASQLERLGRIHAVGEIEQAYHKARAGGFDNINLDVMWGLPEQDTAQALEDLRRAIDLQPEHMSWYQLTLEPKTEFARRPPRLPPEGALADMEQAGLALLAEAGYQRYEVSAFARPGRTCRHNMNYWTFGDYTGIGAGAHGKHTEVQIIRSRKASQPRLYQRAPAETFHSPVAPDQIPFEFMMNALRLVDGVAWSVFEHRTGLKQGGVMPVWQPLAEQGLVRLDQCATTERGLRYLDSVLTHFLPES